MKIQQMIAFVQQIFENPTDDRFHPTDFYENPTDDRFRPTDFYENTTDDCFHPTDFYDFTTVENKFFALKRPVYGRNEPYGRILYGFPTRGWCHHPITISGDTGQEVKSPLAIIDH